MWNLWTNFVKLANRILVYIWINRYMEFENVLFFLSKLGCGSELAQKLKPWLESLKAFQAQQGYQQPTVLDSHFIYKFKTFICFFFPAWSRPPELQSHSYLGVWYLVRGTFSLQKSINNWIHSRIHSDKACSAAVKFKTFIDSFPFTYGRWRNETTEYLSNGKQLFQQPLR